MNDCVFCRIVGGDIPCHRVYEDEGTLAFLDIHPANRGHVLVIPKRHAETFDALDEEGLAALFRTAQRTARALTSSLSPAGYNLLMNNGKAAGQLVPHAHLHIIPRFPDDFTLKLPEKTIAAEELSGIAEAIAKHIR